MRSSAFWTAFNVDNGMATSYVDHFKDPHPDTGLEITRLFTVLQVQPWR